MRFTSSPISRRRRPRAWWSGSAPSVEVDALPGQTLRGHVESFAPGSGSQFSLLPFEPGTGNFTKIVQRVPVRIRFDAGQPALARLRPGLSSTVTVRLQPHPHARRALSAQALIPTRESDGAFAQHRSAPAIATNR